MNLLHAASALCTALATDILPGVYQSFLELKFWLALSMVVPFHSTVIVVEDTIGGVTSSGADLSIRHICWSSLLHPEERKGVSYAANLLAWFYDTDSPVTGDLVHLTGEEKLRSGNVVPRHPFIPVAGKMGPGTWELGVRYAKLEFDSKDPVNFFNGNLARFPGGRSGENGAEALTLGLNWYMNEQVRFMLNWSYYWFDNSFGTPFSCATSSCTAAIRRSAGKVSWEILSRLQSSLKASKSFTKS